MPHDEFFDVYYDISESLFDRLRETMDHLAHLRGLMILVKLVLSDFRENAKSLRETAECFEFLGLKPTP